MKFSAQEEYGLRCLVQLAKVGTSGSLTIPEISRLEGLTSAHVAKLMAILRKGGFVASTRGQAGGYTLSRPAEEIRIGEALAELGGKLYDDEFCSRHAGHGEVCHHDTDCGVRFLWNRVQDAVDHALEGMTLADLLPTPAGVNARFFSAPVRRV